MLCRFSAYFDLGILTAHAHGTKAKLAKDIYNLMKRKSSKYLNRDKKLVNFVFLKGS